MNNPIDILKKEYTLAAFTGAVAAGVPPEKVMATVETYVSAAFDTPALKAKEAKARALQERQREQMAKIAQADAQRDIAKEGNATKGVVAF